MPRCRCVAATHEVADVVPILKKADSDASSHKLQRDIVFDEDD